MLNSPRTILFPWWKVFIIFSIYSSGDAKAVYLGYSNAYRPINIYYILYFIEKNMST